MMTNWVWKRKGYDTHFVQNCKGNKNGIPGYMNEGGYVDIARVLEHCGLEVQECHLNSEQDFLIMKSQDT